MLAAYRIERSASLGQQSGQTIGKPNLFLFGTLIAIVTVPVAIGIYRARKI